MKFTGKVIRIEHQESGVINMIIGDFKEIKDKPKYKIKFKHLFGDYYLKTKELKQPKRSTK